MLIDENLYLFEGEGAECNCYVLVAGDGLVLVDTGTGADTDGLLRKMRNAGLDPEKIRLVVNTHCHYDHIGGNFMIQDRFGAKIAAHHPDTNYIAKPDGEYTAAKYAQTPPKASNVSIVLEDGQEIEGTDFRVIHTPGHTAGGICLYSEKRLALISGDTSFAEGGTGRVDLPGGDLDALIKSLDTLSKLRVKMLLPGHGEPEYEEGYKSIVAGLRFVKAEML